MRYLQTIATRSSALFARPLSSSTTIHSSTHPSKTIVRNMSSAPDIENKDVKTATGVTLGEQEKTLVGSVLDVGFTPRSCSLGY
jgi:hypothetical protein